MLTFTPSPDRFVVEEIPAYTPSGEGTHTFLWLEKRGLTTFDAIALVARALGVQARDIGYAGMKDKQATTRQWLSVPGVEPERALALADGGVRVLTAARHGNKLRTVHVVVTPALDSKGQKWPLITTHPARRKPMTSQTNRSSSWPDVAMTPRPPCSTSTTAKN